MDIIDLADQPQLYRVSPRDRQPLVDFMVRALEARGCRVLAVSRADRAPFKLAFENPSGERMEIRAYAFLANNRLTRNRPDDEHRFQIKYGSKPKGDEGRELQELWQDPWGVETTLLLGINTETGFWVAADPVLHSPTRFFISVEFKQEHADRILEQGWAYWERDRRSSTTKSEPVEVLIGGRPETFLDLVYLERLAKGLDPGHRLAFADARTTRDGEDGSPSSARSHPLLKELELPPGEVFDLIQSAPRLKMAVRGWVAEEHLYRAVSVLDGIQTCERLEGEGKADLELCFRGHRFSIECKNVLRTRLADGTIRVDFQRTRSAKSDPCSRFYAPTDFDIVAACLHSCTGAWDFRFVLSGALDPHPKCEGKLDSRVQLDARWSDDLLSVLESAVALRVAGGDVASLRPVDPQMQLFDGGE
jgi:hypothetical protein